MGKKVFLPTAHGHPRGLVLVHGHASEEDGQCAGEEQGGGREWSLVEPLRTLLQTLMVIELALLNNVVNA